MKELEEIKRICRLYPEQQAAVMQVLWMAQKKFGWLKPDVIDYVASILNMPKAEVHGIASFYTMYFTKPAGAYHVQVCTNVSCMIRGGEKILDHVCSKLGIRNNETTADGKFSLEEVECMGACGGSPMLAVNEEFSFLSVLASLR